MTKFQIKPAEIGEMTSLVVSIIIMMSLVSYLAYASLREQAEQLAVSSTVGTVVEAGMQSGQYVVPVDIANHGTRGIAALHLDIAVASQHHAIELQYLAADAQRRIYVYSPTPTQPDVVVTPLSYHID